MAILSKNHNPLNEFSVDRNLISYVGKDLQRPECILAERDGTLWVADARGGVTRIDSDGTQEFIGQKANSIFESAIVSSTETFESKFTIGTLPNGMAFSSDSQILIANFGTDVLETMDRQGNTRTLYDRIDGQPIGKVNFVLRDSKNRICILCRTNRLCNYRCYLVVVGNFYYKIFNNYTGSSKCQLN